jgi:type I restriction enzyme R subunit
MTDTSSLPQRPTEGGVEQSMLRWLRDTPGLPEGLQWTVYGLQDDAGDRTEGAKVLDDQYDRESGQVVYWQLLREQLMAINDAVTEQNVDRLLPSIRRAMDQDELMAGNRAVHQLLREGIRFDTQHGNGTTKIIYAKLIDFARPERNRFDAVNQMRVTRRHSVRPDVTLLVNGIPLVQVELKSLAQENDFTTAISDLHAYEEKVPRLFLPTLFNVAADTQELRYGAIQAPRKFYFPWSDAPDRFAILGAESDKGLAMKQAVQALLNPETLLDILRNFVFYEKAEGGDVKIVPRHMQYYAVERILGRLREGDPEKKRGLIWHTQGSGKSYTMLYAAHNLLERSVLEAPQVFILVDSDKLATQMADNLSAIGFERSVVCRKIKHLQQVIEKGQSQLVLTTMQAFQDVDPDVQSNPNVVVMADEAHRFMEKQLGSRLEAALPDAWNFGFTGTPVHEGEGDADRNTYREYCPVGDDGEREDPLHTYSILQGQKDGVILPVHFTLRHEAEWDVDEAAMDEAFDEAFAEKSKDEKLSIIQEALTPTDLGELAPRVDAYADVIAEHYAEKLEPNGWKGMVVAPSRRSAAMYGERLQELRGDSGDVAVLYTTNEDDAALLRQFTTTAEERDQIVRRFKRQPQPKLLVVHHMLLTGFDAPILKTMYLDRKLTDHNLLQAIARTNRPAEGKVNGEIVDFQGVFANLDDALHYDEETVRHAARDKDELFDEFTEQLGSLFDLFDGIRKDDSQEAVQEALARVSKHPTKRQFEQGYRRLQDLYESVSPDGRLVRPEIRSKYSWLSGVWVAFRRANNRSETPENDVREKTLQIVEEHVDVSRVKEDFPIYEIGEDHLQAVKEMKRPEAKATSIAHTTKAHLTPRVDQNPRFERLSERVEDVLARWQDGQIADPEAVEALEEIEREVIAIENEREDRGVSEAEYAVFSLLTDDYGVPEDEAQSFASDLCAKFQDEVDTNFPGWQTNAKALRKIKVLIYKSLPRLDVDADKKELADDLRSYLVANAE